MDSHNMPVTPEEYKDAVTVIINRDHQNSTFKIAYRDQMILKKLTRDFGWLWNVNAGLQGQLASIEEKDEVEEFSGKPNDIDQPRGVGLAGD